MICHTVRAIVANGAKLKNTQQGHIRQKKNEKRTVKCKNDPENARKTWQITPRWISCGQEIFSIISMDLDTLNPWDYKVRNVALCESSDWAFQVFAIRMLNFGCRAIFILPDFARPIIWIISNIIIILCELMVLCNFDVLYLNRLVDTYLIRKFSKFSWVHVLKLCLKNQYWNKHRKFSLFLCFYAFYLRII